MNRVASGERDLAGVEDSQRDGIDYLQHGEKDLLYIPWPHSRLRYVLIAHGRWVQGS